VNTNKHTCLGRVCFTCGVFKEWKEFNRDKNRISGHISSCKVCTKNRSRSFYNLHKSRERTKHKKYYHSHKKQYNLYCGKRKTHYKIIRKKYITKIIKENKKLLLTRYMPGGRWICKKCHKEFCCVQMAAHHPDQSKKRYVVARIVKSANIHRYFAELDKCEWFCRRCHNHKMSDPNLSYYETNKRNGRIKDRNVDLLLQNGVMPHCSDCGDFLKPKEWEWHHINSNTKVMEVSKLMASSFVRLLSEIQKCKLLCANCHVLRHYST
jgi:hypothetical protein